MIPEKIRYIFNRFSGTHFGDVLKGSSVYSIAKVAATVLGFGASLLIGYFYNAEVLGRIATMSSLFALMSLLALMGNQSYVLRTIPTLLAEKGAGTAFRAFLKIASLVGIAGVIVVILAAILLPKADNLFQSIANYQYLLFGLILATALKKISLPSLRAMGDYRIYSVFEVLPALFMITVVLIGVAFSVSHNAFIYIYFTPHFILALLAFFIAWREFERRRMISVPDAPKYQPGNASSDIPSFAQMLAVSVPMMGVNLSNAVIAHTDILMLSSFTDEKTVGVFSIYVKISALMSIGIAATNSMFAPKASRLFDAGKIGELGKLARQTSSLIFIVALVSLIGILVIHRVLLGFYGAEFFDYILAFYILLLALMVNAFFGAVGVLLNMTGQQNYFFKIIVTAAIMNAVSNYFLIPVYGPVGAAVSTLLTIIYWNSMAMIRVKKVHGFVTFPIFSLPFKKT